MHPYLSQTGRKILSVLFGAPLQKFKEIELIQKGKTGKGAAGEFIDALRAEGILHSQRVGKANLVSLNLSHPRTFLLKNLWDQEKLGRLSRPRLATALYFVRELANSASMVILFGSTTAGTATPDSDLDMVVVSSYKEKVLSARSKAEELFGQRINLHDYTLGAVISAIRTDPLLQNAMLHGVILAGYDLGRVLYAALESREQRTIDRLLFFKERIQAARRNYVQKDYESAQEIISQVQEQFIFYLLSARGLSYSSKSDAAKQIKNLPEGKRLKSIASSHLREKIDILEGLVLNRLMDGVMEEAGYGTPRD